jgi:purine-nucleoside phosphorylase
MVATTDLFYEPEPGEGPRRAGAEGARAEAVEMEAATLFALGPRIGVAVACLLVVSDTFGGGERNRIGDEPMAEAAERMGAVATAALAPD